MIIYKNHVKIDFFIGRDEAAALLVGLVWSEKSSFFVSNIINPSQSLNNEQLCHMGILWFLAG